MRTFIVVGAQTALAVAVCLAGFLLAPFAFPFTFLAAASLWFVPSPSPSGPAPGTSRMRAGGTRRR